MLRPRRTPRSPPPAAAVPIAVPMSPTAQTPAVPRAALLAAAALAALAPAAPAQTGLLPRPEALRAAGLELAWWAVADVSPGQDRVAEIVADEELVYVRTRANVLTAVDLTTGVKKWSVRLGRDRQVGQPVGSNRAVALAVVGREAYGIDKDSGQTIWQIPLPATPTAPPTVDDDRLYVGAGDGGVYAFDLNAIRELYSEGKLPRFALGTQAWRYASGAPVVGSPVRSGIAALFANRNGVLVAVEAGERKLLWQFEADRAASAPPVADADTVYFASADRNLYAVAVDNGIDRWEFVTRTPVETAPALVGDSLYVVPTQAGVAKVNKASGLAEWRNDRTTGFLAVAGGRAYASDASGNVLALDDATGRPLGAALLNDYDVRASNDRTDRVLVATRGGVVLCLKAAGAGFPVYYKRPDSRPVEPSFADPGAPAPPAGDDPAAAGDPAAGE